MRCKDGEKVKGDRILDNDNGRAGKREVAREERERGRERERERERERGRERA